MWIIVGPGAFAWCWMLTIHVYSILDPYRPEFEHQRADIIERVSPRIFSNAIWGCSTQLGPSTFYAQMEYSQRIQYPSYIEYWTYQIAVCFGFLYIICRCPSRCGGSVENGYWGKIHCIYDHPITEQPSQATNVLFKAFGWAIRHLMVVKENYVSSLG
jgi:hypothetical protein